MGQGSEQRRYDPSCAVSTHTAHRSWTITAPAPLHSVAAEDAKKKPSEPLPAFAADCAVVYGIGRSKDGKRGKKTVNRNG